MRASRMLLEPGSSSRHKKGTVCVKSANVKAIQCHELMYCSGAVHETFYMESLKTVKDSSLSS